MQKRFNMLIVYLLCSLPGFAAPNAFAVANAASEKDPAAWYSKDETPRDKYDTAKKEASAAYRDALNSCREVRGSKKKICADEAKAVYKKDMMEAKRLLAKS